MSGYGHVACDMPSDFTPPPPMSRMSRFGFHPPSPHVACDMPPLRFFWAPYFGPHFDSKNDPIKQNTKGFDGKENTKDFTSGKKNTKGFDVR